MKHTIGIDIGGTSIKYSLVEETGKPLFENKIPSQATISREAVIAQISDAIQDAIGFANSGKIKVSGIGIGTPGIINSTQRVILGGAENIKGWEKLKLADILEKEFNLPVLLANDANTMALGETLYGAGQGCENIVFLTIGTGIGGAIIINGKLYSGYDNRGGELGHVPFIANGKQCACGSTGCFEAYASTSALINRFMEQTTDTDKKLSREEINGELIVRLYKEGDPIAKNCMEEHCDFVGHGIAGFINIFSPELVIVGGGISESGEFYIEKIRKNAFRYAMADCAINTKIVAAKLGNKAGYIGAASLFFKGNF
ncbi:MAG: ROK family protein [Dysgonomonadaceae bacterium]|nr:ROK family protein [Dysgonamonadaceae bacterium]